MRLSPAGFAFLVAFLTNGRVLTTLLLFPSDPVMATAFNGAVVVVLLYVTALFALAASRPMVVPPFNAMATLQVLFAAWIGLSNLWSYADSKAVAFSYFAVEVACSANVLILMAVFGVERMFRPMLRGFAAASALMIVVLVGMGAWSAEGRLGDELFLHPNTVGRMSAIAAVCAFYLFTTKREDESGFWQFTLMAVLSIGVFLSLSKTSIAVYLLSIVFMMATVRSSSGKKLAFLLIALISAAASFGEVIAYLEKYLSYQSSGSLDTLSGRTTIWRMTWDMVLENPWIGYGALSFRDVGPQIAAVRLVHAHNEFLHITFSYGVVGLVLAVGLYAAWIGGAVALMRRNGDRRLGAFALCIAVDSLTFGVTEAGVLGLILPMAQVLGLSLMMRERRRGSRTANTACRYPLGIAGRGSA